MLHNLIAEFLSTGLMILFGVGVHCDEVLTNTNITEVDTSLRSQHGPLASVFVYIFLVESV